LAFQLCLIVCCLFAPAEKKTFEIEMRDGKQDKGVVLFVQRTESGFSVYSDREMKGSAIRIEKEQGERYVITEEKGGKTVDHIIDNGTLGIAPLEKEGRFTKEINGCNVQFELSKGVRTVHPEGDKKTFRVR
jgi:hypothetical protein